MAQNWNSLLKMAEAEVKETLARLPLPLRSQAAALPISFEPHPSKRLLRDGLEPDTLGLFIGPDFSESDITGSLPAHVVLFLENIWNSVDGDQALYRDEVQTTLLHELGHFLGLGELDLEGRGLD